MNESSKGSTWVRLLPDLNEAQRRWLMGAHAMDAGRGGLAMVQRRTGAAATTILRGMREIRSGRPLHSVEGVRHEGGGRISAEDRDTGILRSLKELLEGATAGEPTGPLLWTHKSTRTLATELGRRGYHVSHTTVARLLADMDYSLQANRRTKEGFSPPERDTQFRYINGQVKAFQSRGDPVLSVDCKKKENVGEFKNSGRTWRPKGQPVEVNVYDFPSLGKGRAIPYGVYDIARNHGFVNVGITHETAEFAVESLRRWWRLYGRRLYADADGWLVCADGGGSNGYRNRGWKVYLQALLEETGMPVTVCHYPTGTSKWNRIEHRMFSFISSNWKGKPLDSYATIVNLIGGTRTKGGLKVKARLDRKKYEKGEEITDEQMAELNIVEHDVNPQWNYTIYPNKEMMRKEKGKENGYRKTNRRSSRKS